MQQITRSIEPETMFSHDKAVFMLGEELKQPLITIKALAESTENTAIQLEAKRALRSIDNLLYYQQVARKQQSLQFTTVHVGDALTDVSHRLQPLSLERGCETEIKIQSGIAPVYADPTALRLAIESLWQAMIAMTQRPSPLNWHMYKSNNAIRLTVINSSLDLSRVHFSRQNLGNFTKQPYSGIAGPATDLLTSNGIFTLLGGQLTKVRKDGLPGLAISLPISKQLSLV